MEHGQLVRIGNRSYRLHTIYGDAVDRGEDAAKAVAEAFAEGCHMAYATLQAVAISSDGTLPKEPEGTYNYGDVINVACIEYWIRRDWYDNVSLIPVGEMDCPTCEREADSRNFPLRYSVH